MRRSILAVGLVLAVAVVAGAAQNPMTQGYYFTDAGGNDATAAITYTRVSDAETLNFTFTTSDTVAYVMNNTNFTMNDSNALRFGTGGGESSIASNGTNTTWTVTSGKLVLGTDAFNTQIEGAMLLGALSTFTDSDPTPNVAGNSYWATNTTAYTLTDFDGTGIAAGQIIVVISKGTIGYDVTTSGLKGGDTDLSTASGDLTAWIYDGTDWILINFMDVSATQAGT